VSDIAAVIFVCGVERVGNSGLDPVPGVGGSFGKVKRRLEMVK